MIIQCRMISFKVIGVNISFDSCSGFFDIIILCQVSFFILKTSKPSFDHDIISPMTFSIHTLTDTIFFYKIDILLAGKLTSLIWGLAILNALFNAFSTIRVSRVSSTSHPTIQRLCQSITAVRYRNPCLIGIYVMSMDHA